MELKSAARNILAQLNDMLAQISEEDFRKPSPTLNQVTIGQHVRHILEFFICLEEGVEKGVVNYDHRDHDKAIETSKTLAIEVLNRISAFTERYNSDYNLLLEGNYNEGPENVFQVSSNYHRELVYNIEHAIHHMALIKIGIREIAPYVELPADFGIASSTIRFLKSK